MRAEAKNNMGDGYLDKYFMKSKVFRMKSFRMKGLQNKSSLDGLSVQA
jgi:hypothetical protein